MDIAEITKGVIVGYIKKIAKQRQKSEHQIQLVLYLKSQGEVGVYVLDEYAVTDKVVALKDVLGIWAGTHKIVNQFISKSLQSFADESGIDFSVINCMVFKDPKEYDEVKLWLYNKHTALKEITLNELLKE
jgi:hypothetical protein